MRITPQQALERLQSQGKRKAKGKEQLKHISSFGVAEEDIYLFGNTKGGMLTTALDSLPAIIGTWEGDCGDIPPAMKDMLKEYANEIEWYERIGQSTENIIENITENKAKYKAPVAPRQSIDAMLETRWAQTSPYNDLIIIEGKRCVTGCNTTAVAQLMFHWWRQGYTRGCSPTEEYKTESNGWNIQALPARTMFDYKHMTITKPKSDEAKKAVQELMLQIAALFKSDFKPNGTSAYPKTVATCLKNNLNMGCFINYIYASKLGQAKFENFIYNELFQGRPVMIAGWNGNGGGHSFIADGYDAENDMYHVNWGWGGSYDGWFKLSALNPKKTIAYNSNKTAIIGIKPDYRLGDVNDDGEIDIADAMSVVQNAQNNTYSKQADINNDGKVTITDAQIIIDKILGKTEL